VDGVSAAEQVRRLLNEGARLLEEGMPGEAIQPLRRAHELDAGSVPVLLNLGGACIMTGNYAEAVPLLEKAREAEPDNPMVWTNLGAAYLGARTQATQTQQLQAITAFEKALELDPGAPSVHYNLGIIYMDREDHDLATAAFRRAIEVNPLDRDAHSWLSRLARTQAEEAE
jgi:Flp pilus assembly protein TadD